MDTWWMESWIAIQREFSDLPDAASVTRVCIRLLVALILGALLGYERETNGSAAGLRTHMLVALGSALFVLVPLQAGAEIEDMTRVLQGLTAGIGFLGAGSIIKSGQEQEVRGLTTAANVWLTAAIGTAVGLGQEATAVLSTLFALIVLALLRVEKKWVDKPENGDQER